MQYEGSSNTRLWPVRSPFGSVQIRWFQESTCVSSKLITEGDIVAFDTVVSTHKRILVAPSSQGAASNLLENGAGLALVGVALAGSTSDGSTLGLAESASQGVNPNRMIPVAVNDGATEFAIQISSVGAAPLVPCSSMIGNVYPVECVRTAVGQRGGHGVWFLSSTNLSTGADLSFVVTDVPDHQIGCTGGHVYGKFLSTICSKAVRLGPVT
jgi:hypothetical protein